MTKRLLFGAFLENEFCIKQKTTLLYKTKIKTTKHKYYNFVISEMAISNMAEHNITDALNYLLGNEAIKQEKVKWGKGFRNVMIIGGKKYQYREGGNINNNLEKKIIIQ